jgi:hypothetical protein
MALWTVDIADELRNKPEFVAASISSYVNSAIASKEAVRLSSFI